MYCCKKLNHPCLKDLWMFLLLFLFMMLLVTNIYSKESLQAPNGIGISHYHINIPVDHEYALKENVYEDFKSTKNHLLEPCMKIFIASMSIELASLTTTIFEFSFIAAAVPLSIIGWILFGIGIGLALIALMLAIGKCMVLHQIKKAISSRSSFY